MCYLGFLENYTYMTTSTKYQLENLDKNEEYIKFVNSVEQGTNMLRLKIFPELLRSLNFNRKNKYPQKFLKMVLL